jgi:ATP-dependent DNA helicase DinG
VTTEAPQATTTPQQSAIPADFAEVEANLARHLPGYEGRPPQQRMARAIEQALSGEQSLYAQAGCGVGKSLGGLIPVLLHAKRTGQRAIVATATKALQEQYCVAPETKILTADLRYIRADEVVTGMPLVGFDEERVGHRRRYRTATVESTTLIERPCYKLTFDDGTTITASSEHKWLTRRGMGVKWMTTKALCVRAGAREGSNIIRLFDTWETDTSYEAGYLAAAWDGEGYLTQTESAHLANGVINKLGFAQRDNEMRGQVQQYLSALGFKYTENIRTDITAVMISTRPEMARFLGQVRPARLLPKFRADGLGTINVQRGVRLISKEFVGTKTVVAMKTSTGTFVAEGLASHNCSNDLPFLQEHSGIPFTWALVKGRSNYACLSKVNSDDMEHDEIAKAVKKELKENPEHSGDREHFAFPIDDYTWSNLASSSNECPGKAQCAFGEICLSEKAKRKGLDAELVITNQAMLMTDLALQERTRGENSAGIQMLGERGVVLFDEGHEIPEYAANALGRDFNPRGVSVLFRDAMAFAGVHGLALDERADACSMIMEPLNEKMLPLVGNALTLAWFVDNSALFEALNDLLKVLYLDLTGVAIRQDVDRQEAKRHRLLKRISNVKDTLLEVLLAEDHERVRWVEGYTVKDTDHWRMKIAPVDVSRFLRENLWEETPCVVMSATLSTGKDRRGNKDFSYIRRTLGLNAEAVDVGTPFDYRTQGLMFVPDAKVPSPKEYGRWAAYASVTTLGLVRASGGGALLLYTSRKAMQSAYEDLAGLLEDEGRTVLMQGDGRTNKELVQIFKEDEHSVLFALKSFFVGVDVPGNACRLVVIDKMPFPVPSDPVFAARSLAEERAGRRSFSSLSIPMMIMSLEQATGRLIRTKKDRGVVAVLDSRLSSTGYGRDIVAALPDFSRTTSMDDVKAFYGAS